MSNYVEYKAVNDVIYCSDYSIQIQVWCKNEGTKFKDYVCKFWNGKNHIEVDLYELFISCNRTFNHELRGLTYKSGSNSNIHVARESYDRISLGNKDFCIELFNYHALIKQVKIILLDYYTVEHEFMNYLTLATLSRDVELLGHYYEKGCKQYYNKYIRGTYENLNSSLHSLLMNGKNSDEKKYYKLYRYEPGFQGCYEDEYGRKRPITGKIEYKIDSNQTTAEDRFIVNTFELLFSMYSLSDKYKNVIKEYYTESYNKVFASQYYGQRIDFTPYQGTIDLMLENINDTDVKIEIIK